MIEWCLQDSSIKMLFAGHEIRDSTKAIRVAARVVFLCVNLFFRAFFHNFPILATNSKTADTQQDGSDTTNRNSKQQEQSQKHKHNSENHKDDSADIICPVGVVLFHWSRYVVGCGCVSISGRCTFNTSETPTVVRLYTAL